DLLAGASVHIISANEEEQRKAIYDLAVKLKKMGKRPFVVRMANDSDLTPDVIAYVECFCEIVEQCNEMGVNPSHLYLSSYDSTQAGLELGRAALGSDIRIMGFAPGVWSTKPVDLITRINGVQKNALCPCHQFYHLNPC
ncbi:unnamed protein product, partial [marine sediment metagenome]